MNETSEFVVKDGKLIEYHGNGGIVTIPEGTESFSWSVFCRKSYVCLDDSIKEIHIPDTVRSITGCVHLYKTIYFPKYLEAMDEVELPDHLIIYDSCKINMVKSFIDFHLSGNTGNDAHIIDVRSSTTDEVLYSVLWDEGGSWHGAYREMINQAWKSLDNFDFDVYDSFSNRLKTPEQKLEQVLFRLKAPYGLSETNKKAYIDYLKRNAKKIVGALITKNDLETLRVVAGYGLLDKREILDEAILLAQKKKRALAFQTFLLQLKKGNGTAPSNSKPGKTQLTKVKPVVGSVIDFGKDPASNKALQWLIIEQTQNKSLVISTEIVATLPFFCKEELKKADYKTVSWQNALLREWLNNDFLNQSFSDSEKELIEVTALKTVKSEPTDDRVFVLNSAKFQRLDEDLLKKLSNRHGDFEYLREIVRGGQYVKAVCLDPKNGDFSNHIARSFEGTCGVRPAMWIKREK